MSKVVRAFIVASCAMTWTSAEVTAAEYLCRKEDSSLRIAVEVEKPGHTLPCNVVAEDDRGERAVLYSARYDRDYCPSRIEVTKSELEQEGWRCDITSEVNVVINDDNANDDADQEEPVRVENDSDDESAPPLANGRTITASHQCRQGDAVRHIQIEVENPSNGKPCELIYWADGARSGPGELLWRADHDATFCPRRLETIVAKWSGEGWRCESGVAQTVTLESADSNGTKSEAVTDQAQEAALAPAESDNDTAPSVVDPTLEAVIAADAERIGEWMEVEPAIEIAGRGDLNDDGSDDAVVFLAYQSDQAAYRQYLMSYVVVDDGYELASVKLLTGVGPPPAQARVEEIDEGVIWLTMPDDETGNPSVPTGYRLHDQELVEVAPENRTDN